MKMMDLFEGRMVSAEEGKNRNLADAKTLLKKMLASAKSKGIHVGHSDLEEQNGEFVIVIENSEGGGRHGFADEMSDIINASPRATMVSKREHDGSFDWKSDTYIKNASEVRFKF